MTGTYLENAITLATWLWVFGWCAEWAVAFWGSRQNTVTFCFVMAIWTVFLAMMFLVNRQWGWFVYMAVISFSYWVNPSWRWDKFHE